MSALAIGFALLATPLLAGFVYVGHPDFNGSSVSAFSIAKDGALIPIPGSLFPTANDSTSVAVDILGRFVYVPTRDNSVSAFSIAKNGALTPVPGSPYRTGLITESVAVDFLGRFVYVARAGNVSAFSVAKDGFLIADVPGSPFAVGGTSIAVSP